MKKSIAVLGAFCLALGACSAPPRWEERAASYALTLEAGELALGVSQDGPAGSWETLTFDLYRDGRLQGSWSRPVDPVEEYPFRHEWDLGRAQGSLDGDGAEVKTACLALTLDLSAGAFSMERDYSAMEPRPILQSPGGTAEVAEYFHQDYMGEVLCPTDYALRDGETGETHFLGLGPGGDFLFDGEDRLLQFSMDAVYGGSSCWLRCREESWEAWELPGLDLDRWQLMDAASRDGRFYLAVFLRGEGAIMAQWEPQPVEIRVYSRDGEPLETVETGILPSFDRKDFSHELAFSPDGSPALAAKEG